MFFLTKIRYYQRKFYLCLKYFFGVDNKYIIYE